MTDALKPPTDNLYKFIAIAGILAAVYFNYTMNQLVQERNKIALEFLSQDDSRILKTNEVKTPDVPFIHFAIHKQPELPNIVTNNVAAQDRWLAHLDKIEQVHDKNRQLPKPGIMKPYFERPSVKDYFIKNQKMSSEEYDKMVSEMTLDKFADLTRQGREASETLYTLTQQTNVAYRNFWNWLNLTSEFIETSDAQFRFFLLIAFIGVVMWYTMSQQYEDMILKAKALEPPKTPIP